MNKPSLKPNTAEVRRNRSDTENDCTEQLAELQLRHYRFATAMASAAHDLKTPLCVISGYVDLLLAQKLGLISGKQRGVLEQMQVQGRHLHRVVEDLLTLGAMESQGIRCRFEVGDIPPCLVEIGEIWQPRFAERGLALFTLSNGRLPSFAFDAVKVQRVISNLLENATKYVPAGGSVTVQAELHLWERRVRDEDAENNATGHSRKERRLSSGKNPNAIRIKVSDTGPGIAPEYHTEIFDEFFRLPEANNATSGMGLGLSIAKRLVQASGGKIWVESEPGAGATFSIVLPLQPPVDQSEVEVKLETKHTMPAPALGTVLPVLTR